MLQSQKSFSDFLCIATSSLLSVCEFVLSRFSKVGQNLEQITDLAHQVFHLGATMQGNPCSRISNNLFGEVGAEGRSGEHFSFLPDFCKATLCLLPYVLIKAITCWKFWKEISVHTHPFLLMLIN
uniref:Uncharacterized protein n=1 Tax=Sphaerodactylus townsendi TaxID=933632 RepID=A0ACB8F3I1_9SAUR